MDKDKDKLPSGRNTHVKGTHKHAGNKTRQAPRPAEAAPIQPQY
jgi:hypothetical protein